MERSLSFWDEERVRLEERPRREIGTAGGSETRVTLLLRDLPLRESLVFEAARGKTCELVLSTERPRNGARSADEVEESDEAGFVPVEAALR